MVFLWRLLISHRKEPGTKNPEQRSVQDYIWDGGRQRIRTEHQRAERTGAVQRQD